MHKLVGKERMLLAVFYALALVTIIAGSFLHHQLLLRFAGYLLLE